MKTSLPLFICILFCHNAFAQRTLATCDCLPANNKPMVTITGNIVDEGVQTFRNGFKKYKYHPYLQFSNHTDCTAEILFVKIGNKILYPRLRIPAKTNETKGFEKEFIINTPIIFSGSRTNKSTPMVVNYRLNTKPCSQTINLLLNQDDTN